MLNLSHNSNRDSSNGMNCGHQPSDNMAVCSNCPSIIRPDVICLIKDTMDVHTHTGYRCISFLSNRTIPSLAELTKFTHSYTDVIMKCFLINIRQVYPSIDCETSILKFWPFRQYTPSNLLGGIPGIFTILNVA